MLESEGDNRKSKEKRLFCCHYQNIYVLLQKQKTRVTTQHPYRKLLVNKA